jgi:hypothetical protein
MVRQQKHQTDAITMNEKLETLEGRFAALQACVTAIVATSPKTQLRECVHMLLEQLADPSINDYTYQPKNRN